MKMIEITHEDGTKESMSPESAFLFAFSKLKAAKDRITELEKQNAALVASALQVNPEPRPSNDLLWEAYIAGNGTSDPYRNGDLWAAFHEWLADQPTDPLAADKAAIQAKTLPLWEVWERLRAALDMIEMDDPNAPDTTMGGKWGTPPGEYGRMAAKMVQPIRAVLLERCSELVDCTEGHFSINHNLILKISRGEIQAFKDASAIFAFWAWELEQLGKEAKGGD